MRILVLGGITESKQLTRRLLDLDHDVIYSLVGMVRIAQLDCETHLGGFSDRLRSGSEGLADFCRNRKVRLIVDATHPYATKISNNAALASSQANIACWRYNRPGWDRPRGDCWRSWHQFDDLLPRLQHHRRPFFTIGSSALRFVDSRPHHQHWVVRTATQQPTCDGVTVIHDIGPFSYADEVDLMKTHRVDALVSKDSGGQRTVHKLDAARDLGIPLYIQTRPRLTAVDLEFDCIDTLIDAVALSDESHP